MPENNLKSLSRRAFLSLSGLALGGTALPATANRTATLTDRDLDAFAESARSFDALRAVVVSHRGEQRLAEAFRGPPVNEPVNVKSVSKTLVSIVTGLARDRGVFESVDATLEELVPELIPAGSDPRVSQLTLRQFLTMQAGQERTSGRGYGAWVNSRDWVNYVLQRPFVAEPGGRMLYSTGSYHVLGAVLTELSGQSLYTMSRDWLGEPLGIEILPWTRDPQGRYLGGNEMALSPEAMVRVGELYRLGGAWQGSRVLSESWIKESWVARTLSPYSGHDYGYGWFIAHRFGHAVYYARGYGGQMIFVIPDLELTIAITSDPNRPARSFGYAGQLHRLVTEHAMRPLVRSGSVL